MRHGKKVNHLGRTNTHRKAMLSNMATSLVLHKRINTTVAKAKALRKYVDPLFTRAKEDTTHSRRMAFRYLRDKKAVRELFDEIAEKVADRPGGYTRILRTGNRLGDNAEMCIIELVDYNENLLTAKKTAPEKAQSSMKTRRSRRGGKKKSSGDSASGQAAKSEAKKEQPADKEKAQPEAKKDKGEKQQSARIEDKKAASTTKASAEKPSEAEKKKDSGKEADNKADKAE